MKMYRFQIPPNGDYTEWRSLDQKPLEKLVLNIEFKNCSEPEIQKWLNENICWPE